MAVAEAVGVAVGMIEVAVDVGVAVGDRGPSPCVGVAVPWSGCRGDTLECRVAQTTVSHRVIEIKALNSAGRSEPPRNWLVSPAIVR